MKISKRLQFIFNLLPREGESFWDLFTDHGLLLIKAATDLKYKKFYGVDAVQSLVDKLQAKTSYIPSSEIILKCELAQKIELDSNNVITLLGVGTKTISETLEHFENQNCCNTYIISSHKDTFSLREYLFNKGLNFISEHFIQDNGKGYEIIVLNNDFPKKLTPRFGFDIWLNKDVKNYKLLKINALYKTRRADNLSIINYLELLEA